MGADQDPAMTGRTGRVTKLEARIAESRHLRSLMRDPDLVAVQIEKLRRRTTLGLYGFLALGLVFTTAGVQRFLAAGTTPADPLWWAAWTVEPMLAGLLLILLNFEATILAHAVKPDSEWLSRLKTVLMVATLFMNVFPQVTPLWGQGEFHGGSAVVHALVPIVIYGLAEVLPVVQARLTTVIRHAYAHADQATPNVQAPKPIPQPASPAPQPASPQPQQAGTGEAAAKLSGVKLPAHMLEAISRAHDDAAAHGTGFTAEDVRAVVKVPADMAERIAAELHTHNGHALT